MSYAQIIYNRLRQAGMTEAGALGVIGNFDCESNCEPYRVQNDNSPYRTISKAYVNAIRLGQLSQNAFANDQKGFGLAQWTYPARKTELYAEWKKSGKAIDDVNFQMDFAIMEFKRDFAADFAILCKTYDINEAVHIVCDRFENPLAKNYDARFRAATRIKFEINLNDWSSQSQEPINDEDDQKNDYVDHSLTLRTIDKNCEDFEECDLLIDVLQLRHYLGANECCSGQVWSAVKQFQEDNGLVPDGIVGPLTWGKLLERE